MAKYKSQRGLSHKEYERYRYRIAKGETSWAELEASGQVPKPSKGGRPRKAPQATETRKDQNPA